MRNSVKNDSKFGFADKIRKKIKSAQPKPRRVRKVTDTRAIMVLIGFLVGLVSGYLFGIQTPEHELMTETTQKVLMEQINPPEGYILPARFGNIGPQLIAAGAIDINGFIDLYEQKGQPLKTEQLTALRDGSNDQIVINRENANFLLNLFWAFGLANENPILTEGLMMNYGLDGVVNFASTGGWTLGSKPVEEIYANTPIVSLSNEQQRLLQKVAAQVFRPCCNNPTFFPDCNHGMAMLGMFELMISQGATEDALYDAAKYVNAFWFGPQNFELAMYFNIKKNIRFDHLEPRIVVGRDYAFATGFQEVHQWLVNNNELQQVPGGENNCGV